LYLKGRGVPQSFELAAMWFYRAAIQGQGEAQYQLGMLYNKGQGVPRDYVLAYMWLNLSASQAVGEDQDFKSRMRDAIATKMTERQVRTAQIMAVDLFHGR
jgi:TPR repeat protein